MPSEITCPVCGQRLQLLEQEPRVPLTCPGCLAKLEITVAATQPGHGTRTRGAPDREIRNDTRRTGIGLILLAILGGLGLAGYFLPATAVAVRGDAQALVTGLIILAFLALVATGLVMARTRANPAARGIGRVVVGTLALVGTLIVGWFALMIFLFVVCLAGLGPKF